MVFTILSILAYNTRKCKIRRLEQWLAGAGFTPARMDVGAWKPLRLGISYFVSPQIFIAQFAQTNFNFEPPKNSATKARRRIVKFYIKNPIL